MEIALFITIVLGLVSVLLSWELDRFKKSSAYEKRIQENKIKKFSIFRAIQEKIAYTKSAEQSIDVIISKIKDLFDYSAASSMVIKDANIVFKIYANQQIGNDYTDLIEKTMLSSLSQLAANLPAKIDKFMDGAPLNHAIKSTYSSSLHIPLIVNNKVAALIHLSSVKENLYQKSDMETLRELMGIAASSLTRFNQALDAEKEILTSLINSINNGIIMADNKNNLLFINEAAQKNLGLIKNNVSFFDIAHILSDFLNLESQINDVILSNNPYIAKGVKINEVILDIFINPIQRGKVSVVLNDITEYKKWEILKDDTTHIMVHELRAPITTIKDSAELILTTNDTLEEDKKLKFLKIIHDQAKKLLEQIGSILDTAKLDAGKLILQKTKGDIAQLIQEEIKTFMPQAEKKDIALNLKILTKSLPLIFFDTERIIQVIDNLLSNSLKFTNTGGKIQVKIDYKPIPPVLDGLSPMENFLSLDKYIVVSVSDNGIGIDKDQQKLLFSKYIQAKNTPHQLEKLGTGLGLYVIKGVVESHSGLVWVKSTPGKGTTISFTLPVTDGIPKVGEEIQNESPARSTINTPLN